MKTVTEAVQQGVGLYTPQEAAMYARMNTRTLTDWFFNEKRFRAPQISEGAKMIGFLDLVEALAIRNLRFHHNISFQVIREAVSNAKELFDSDYPFADRDHRPVLVGSELNIIHRDSPETLVAISGGNVGQSSIKNLIEPWMLDIEFDQKGIAKAYRPYAYKDQTIVLDPEMNFGSPVVENCNYPAETLWHSARAEGSFEAVAEEYEIPVACVEIAVRFYTKDLNLAA